MTSARVCLRTGLWAACAIAVFLRAAGAVPRQLNEGDRCRDGGASGRCVAVGACASARRALRQRRPPPARCGFVGDQEVVCCTEAANVVVGSAGGGRRGDRFRGNGLDYDDPRRDGGGGGDDDDDDDDRDERDGSAATAGSRDFRRRQQPAASKRRSDAECEVYKAIQNGPTNHILGGHDARDEEFPHMAALGYQVPGKKELSWLCAGSLISEQYVLTAAHCCNNRDRPAPVRVQLGTANLSSSRAGSTRYGISDIVIHADYSRSSYRADIALLRLDRRASFSRTVSPACLYTRGGDPPAALIVTGWGATNPLGTKQSRVLQEGTVRSLPFSRCQQYKQRFPEGLDSSVICAGDPQGVVAICDGDSGGPLVAKEDTFTYSIVGITSIGPSPCGGNIPSLYTRVSSYIDWIEKYVWP
ncbi:serine protease Hayan-like [Schistocerca piceifrons]|uniref:serine protease Hayan-like n=1 Tax=Schistocerca piceifrons TaxID=274613 RepID=UPI001F5EAC0A|nr:serine protease Hayan-like [Schistocerca piceifrons]